MLSGPPVRDAVATDSRSLAEIYDRIFEAVPADTDALRDECYRVRYQVYCVENKFEPADDKPDGRERDAFDARAWHGLLRFRRTGACVGTIRIIPPDEAAGPEAALPMYQICAANGVKPGALPPAGSTLEISRFAISKEFRKRADDALYGRVYDREELARDDRRMIPHLTLGLMRLALELSRGRDAKYVCAVMEPTLIRLLGRLGIHWQAIGPMVEHHGLRQPCIAPIDTLTATIKAERPEVWDVICGATPPPVVPLPAALRA
jgi:N-acyl amino acid synthase of PEP-CTERM/exosortase system